MLKLLFRKILHNNNAFTNSESYWEKRYARGGNSGPGSYNKLAEFKAKILNTFIHENNVNTVIEWGCGDGNQIALADYPNYIGLDVSDKAVQLCKNKFSSDSNKRFLLADRYSNQKAELALSLDVIYHLVEDDAFNNYMVNLFNSATSFVIIYSSNDTNISNTSPHVKHRRFTDWIDENMTMWELVNKIPNEYPFDGKNIYTGSFSDFYFFRKTY